MHAIIRVLKYLVHTKAAQLVYRGTRPHGSMRCTRGGLLMAPQPVVFTDSDWGSEDGGLSRAGWTAKLGGGAITFYSKKLASVALSSAEAEYKALSEGAKEAIWLRQLYEELHLAVHPIKLYCDNQAADSISKNPVQHHRTRHFRLYWHYVREVQDAGEVTVHFVKSCDQDADVLTKALVVELHQNAAARLGMTLA